MNDVQKELFYLNLIELEKIIEYLNPIYGTSTNLFEKKTGIFHIFRNLQNNLKFFGSTMDESPFTSFTTLARMIIDQYSVFFILTSYSNEEIQKLRYYLLIIDSLKERSNTIIDFKKSSKELSSETSSENTIISDQKLIKDFYNKIESENLNHLTSKMNITKNNWKFETSEFKACNNNFYNWKELYQISQIPKNYSKSIQNHYSQFTHGMALTILYNGDMLAARLSTITILFCIQSLIGKIILKEFKNELEHFILDHRFINQNEYIWEN